MSVFDPKPLWVAHSLFSPFAFVSRIFCSTCKEIDVCPVQVDERLLEDLTIGFFKPVECREMFEPREHLDGIVPIQALAGRFVVLLPQVAEIVIHEPGMPELNGQPALLFFVEVDPELVCFLDPHDKIIAHMFAFL